VDGEFLLRLREHTEDAALKAQIDDKCMGQNAAILLYLELKRQNAIPASVELEYRPRIEKARSWLVAHTAPDINPPDGYIRLAVAETTRKPAVDDSVDS